MKLGRCGTEASEFAASPPPLAYKSKVKPKTFTKSKLSPGKANSIYPVSNLDCLPSASISIFNQYHFSPLPFLCHYYFSFLFSSSLPFFLYFLFWKSNKSRRQLKNEFRSALFYPTFESHHHTSRLLHIHFTYYLPYKTSTEKRRKVFKAFFLHFTLE